MEVLQDRDVTNIQVHLCLSAFKHLYAKVMTELYCNFLFSREKEIIKSEYRLVLVGLCYEIFSATFDMRQTMFVVYQKSRKTN